MIQKILSTWFYLTWLLISHNIFLIITHACNKRKTSALINTIFLKNKKITPIPNPIPPKFFPGQKLGLTVKRLLNICGMQGCFKLKSQLSGCVILQKCIHA